MTLDEFENTVNELNKKAGETPHHFVLNAHESQRASVETIQTAIANAQPLQLLDNLDLRPIFHADGTPGKWSLEACSATKSLASIGESPSA